MTLLKLILNLKPRHSIEVICAWGKHLLRVLRRRVIVSNDIKKTDRTEQYESAEPSNKKI
jgi:hypothetical protein